jgi:hypothetical protein
MQRQITYDIRKIARQALLQMGPMTLSELSKITGVPKDKLRYAIESTCPFDALFRKSCSDGVCEYEAIPTADVYGGKSFY